MTVGPLFHQASKLPLSAISILPCIIGCTVTESGRVGDCFTISDCVAMHLTEMIILRHHHSSRTDSGCLTWSVISCSGLAQARLS